MTRQTTLRQHHCTPLAAYFVCCVMVLGCLPVVEPELQNFLHVSHNVFSGGEPHGEEDFVRLRQLGVRTVVSVDGARPDVENAQRHGLRYVHIPIGYDGISDAAGLALARLASEMKGPIYVHCHHGKHRGPAAAAVVCIAAGDFDPPAALGYLERAGTSKNYAGLYRDVENYEAPGVNVDLPALVEVAEVESFAAAMAAIDRAYDHLKLCRDSHWQAPPGHPDLVPAQEALLLKESLHESARNLVEEFDDEFMLWLAEAESQAKSLETALHDNSGDEATQRFQQLEQSCQQCHAKYRN